jgi:hypothetical protein
MGDEVLFTSPPCRAWWGGFLASPTTFDGLIISDYQAHTIALPAWYGTQMTVLKRGGQIMMERRN